MFGNATKSTITKVCEEAFKLRVAGTRGKWRASTGTYVSAGYTVSYASGMHSCITPYRNFKKRSDQSGENQAHDSAMSDVSAVVFNTTMRVLHKIPRLNVVGDTYDQMYEEHPTLPRLDGGYMGSAGNETLCNVGGFEFKQGYAKVTNTFLGRCATSQTHVDDDVTPVILYICKREGPDDGGGMFYNMEYGFGVNLIENITLVFLSDHLHGSTVLRQEVILNAISQSVTRSTLDGLRRYDMFIKPKLDVLQHALGVRLNL